MGAVLHQPRTSMSRDRLFVYRRCKPCQHSDMVEVTDGYAKGIRECPLGCGNTACVLSGDKRHKEERMTSDEIKASIEIDLLRWVAKVNDHLGSRRMEPTQDMYKIAAILALTEEVCNLGQIILEKGGEG